jgi:hypothetical protein
VRPVNDPRKVGVFLLIIPGGILALITSYLLVLQVTGERAIAEVADCYATYGGRTMFSVLFKIAPCKGTWTASGATHSGSIANTSEEDEGQRIEVRARGDRAIKPGYAHIFMFEVGVACVVGGAWLARRPPVAGPDRFQ